MRGPIVQLGRVAHLDARIVGVIAAIDVSQHAGCEQNSLNNLEVAFCQPDDCA